MDNKPEIVPVAGPEALALLRGLLEEYWQSFGFTPCFQNFSGELARLPGDYTPPDGRLAMAWTGGEATGCIALRRFDDLRAEVKRLYVRPASRGCGLGRRLMDWVIAEARAAGYSELVCDTMPVMREALALYDRMGFEQTEPYAAQPTEGAVFLRLPLLLPERNRDALK
jgi:ribosomal protein S18 acetylase RimI-like enzyme